MSKARTGHRAAGPIRDRFRCEAGFTPRSSAGSGGAALAPPLNVDGQGGLVARAHGESRERPGLAHDPSGDIAVPIRGCHAHRQNMEASLQIPTATSVRTIPVRTLEENRRLLNKHRDAPARGQGSFTHIIAFAMLRGSRRSALE